MPVYFSFDSFVNYTLTFNIKSYSEYRKLSSGQRAGKSVFITITKKGNAKECSYYCTIAHISHASKIMLKILQARLQQYVK